jgi:alkylation response protein AidB-like acyl-CoA dehydrogenase
VNEDDFSEILREVRRFVRNEVVPLEAQIDERDEVPEALREQAKAMGLYGFALPEEHGGAGMTMVQEVRRSARCSGPTTGSPGTSCWKAARRSSRPRCCRVWPQAR